MSNRNLHHFGSAAAQYLENRENLGEVGEIAIHFLRVDLLLKAFPNSPLPFAVFPPCYAAAKSDCSVRRNCRGLRKRCPDSAPAFFRLALVGFPKCPRAR